MNRLVVGSALLALIGAPHAGRPQCQGCRLEAVPVVTLGKRDAPGELSSIPAAIARDSRGRYVVVVPWGPQPETPLRFGPDGQFLGRVGRVGPGPNEYQEAVGAQVTGGDTVLVFDRELQRLTVLSPDMSLRRTVPVGPANGITRLTTGDYVATRDVGEVEELVFLSPLGEPLGLSRDSAIMCGDVGACTISRRRFLVPDIEGSFWTIRRSFRYELEHRDRRGALRKSLRPQREWFAPFDSLRRLSPGVEPQPEIVGGWAQGNHLFVAGNRSDSAWRQAGWERQRLPEGRSGASTTRVLDPNQLFDGWIEVVDTLTGTAIATAHVPLRLIGVAAPGYVFAARVDTDGFYEVVIYAVRLLPAQAPGRSVPEAWISSLEGQQRD